MNADKMAELRRLAEDFSNTQAKYSNREIDFEEFERKICVYEKATEPFVIIELLDEVERLNKTIEARLGYLGAVVHCKKNDDATCRAKIMNALSDWRNP